MISDAFARCIADVYGNTGREWLAELPALIAELAGRWSLRVQPPFELSYNYVAPAVRADGAPVVLKLGPPFPERAMEHEALRLHGGRGMVRLLDADLAKGAFLLERLLPGVPLSKLEDDEEATRIAAGAMRRLLMSGADPSAASGVLPHLDAWTDGIEKLHAAGETPFPRELAERAYQLRRELLASGGNPVLLHGDLHHDNILSSHRDGWLAIDPKGVVGDPVYECASFLYNPPGFPARPGLHAATARRLDQLADELSFERERIVAWGIVQAVLSAWWSYEDHGQGWEPTLAFAELLAGI